MLNELFVLNDYIWLYFSKLIYFLKILIFDIVFESNL